MGLFEIPIGILVNLIYDIIKKNFQSYKNGSSFSDKITKAFDKALNASGIINDRTRYRKVQKAHEFLNSKSLNKLEYSREELVKAIGVSDKTAVDILEHFEIELLKEDSLYKWIISSYLQETIGMLKVVLEKMDVIEKNFHRAKPEIDTNLLQKNDSISNTIESVRKSLIQLLELSDHNNITNFEKVRTRLSKLHQNLLKLYVIVGEISYYNFDSLNELSFLAGELMAGPIPGPDNFLNTLNSMELSKTKDDVNSSKIALLKRYIQIMKELTESLQNTLVEILHIHSPQLVDNLHQLWRTKVTLTRSLRYFKNIGDEGKKELAQMISEKEEILKYIESARTLEAKTLLQVIDEDARAVSTDFQTGLTIFGELAKHAKLLQAIISACLRDIEKFILS